MSYTASYIVNSSSAQGTTDFTFTFPYIKEEHIEVFLNYSKITQGSGSNQYQVITNVSPKLIRLNTGIASANLRVEVRRNSSLGSPLVDYADGSTLTANDLDTSALQSLYIDQELKDNQGKTVSVDEATGLPSMGESSAGNLRLTKVADPTAAQDAATKNYVDTKVFTSAQIQDGTITSADIANGAIVDADVNASAAISGSKLQASTGSNAGSMSAADKTKLDGIDTGAKDDQTAAEIRVLVESATDSNVFTDADHSKLNAIEAGATTDQTISEIKALIAGSPLGPTHLAESYFTETESDARYFKQDSSETITSGVTWSGSDSYIATTGAIDARITDLVDDVGGFVPIANETSFPNANPDINNGAGTLVSIKALSSNLTSNGSGVATIANGTVGNSTVTITGLAASTTYAANFGMIVETTTTLNTYTFHRQVPIATEVSTVAGSITNVNTVATNINSVNDFADKYRIASSAPSSNNDDGDLYYNTSDNKLYVYNGSAWEVAASLNGSGGTVTGDTTFTDGTKLKVGDSSDLEIYHSTNSYIVDKGSGELRLGSDSGVRITKHDSETCAFFDPDGPIELYYDNSKKFETTSSGGKVTGALEINGTTGNITTNQYGHLFLQNTNNSSTNFWGLSARDNGVLDIGYGTKSSGLIAGDVLTLSSTAATFAGNISLPDDKKAIFGTGDDLQIYSDGSTCFLKSDDLRLRSAGNENYLTFAADGAATLFYDGVNKFETSSTGVTFGDNWLYANDNAQIRLGNGADLQIYHDGSSSRINNSTGSLKFKTPTRYDFYNVDGTENVALFSPNGSCELYYDNVKKIETTTGGIDVSGSVTADDIITAGALLHEGDTDCLVHFSAADTIDLKTGGTARLTVNNSGVNLGSNLYSAGKNISLGDSSGSTDDRLQLGDSQDLEIYHDGTHSYIKDTGTGNLYTHTNYFIVSNAAGTEDIIKGVENGAVELYYDANKKLETYSNGVKCFNHCRVEGGEGENAVLALYADEGDDAADLWIVVSNASSNAFEIQQWNGSAWEDSIKAMGGGAVELYYDGVKKFETYANGAIVYGPEGGSGILGVYADEGDDNADKWRFSASSNGNFYLQNYKSGSWESNLHAVGENSTVLYYDGSEKLETTSTGVKMTGTYLNTVSGSSSGGLHAQSNGCEAFVWAIQNAGNLINGSTAGHMGIRGTSGIDFSGNNGSSLEMSLASGNLTVHNGSVSDSKGNLRSIPINAKSAAYTLVAADAGKAIRTTGDVTLDASIFSEGEAITIFNNNGSTSGTNISIIAGSNVTLHHSTDGSSGNRTLSPRGLATIFCVYSNTFCCSGAGLS